MQQDKVAEETLNLQLVAAVQADSSIESITALIAQKADVNTLDESGLPLLYSAINHVNPAMVRVLLDAKASIKNVEEISVLQYAKKTQLLREQSAKEMLGLIGNLAPQHTGLWPLAGSEDERIRRLQEIVAQLDKRPAVLAGLHARQVATPLAVMKKRPLYDPHLLKTMLTFVDGRAPQKQSGPPSAAALDEGSSGSMEIEEGQKPELKRPAAPSSGTDLSAALSRRQLLLSGGISFASQPGPRDGAMIRDSQSVWALRAHHRQSEIVTTLLAHTGLFAVPAPAAQAWVDDAGVVDDLGIDDVMFDGPG